MSDQENTPNFKVTDKRLFDQEGEVREDWVNEKNSSPEPEGESGGGAAASRQDPRTQEVDFSSFVISLATTALVHMGDGPAGSETPPENLDAARQMIDILSMLEKKTAGNLAADESRLIHDILYELRMKFLAKNKAVQL